MGDALLLFNISRPQRLTELSNVTQMASRTLAGNSQCSDPARTGSRPEASGCRHRVSWRAPHLGAEPSDEPSLMMPGIIISFVFSKQGWLVFRTTPLQNQLARADEPFDHTPNWLVVQIGTTNPPGCARSDLLTLQQACLH